MSRDRAESVLTAETQSRSEDPLRLRGGTGDGRPSEQHRGKLWVRHLGLRAYGEVLELQRAVARDRISGQIPEDVLLLVEHHPVVTLGRGGTGEHLLATPELLAARGVERFDVERGGDVTFHGPGQLVGYPIIDLKRHRRDLHWYLRQIEETLIQTLGAFGLWGARKPGLTGVWIENRKIASIGVHARDWVTWHGFALNVCTDLRYFDLMVPCGIQAVQMTSLENEFRTRTPVANAPGSQAPGMHETISSIVEAFGRVFGLSPVWRDAGAAATAVAAPDPQP